MKSSNKCYIHVGLHPEPKVANSPVEAIALAEKYLRSENDEFPKEESLSVKWRRDDLYPDNFVDYSIDDLVTHLKENGEVVLQLAEIDADGLPIMGEIANIITAAEEDKDTKEADDALEEFGSSLAQSYKTKVTLVRAGKAKTFQPTAKKSKRVPTKTKRLKK